MCDLEVKVASYKFWSKAESAWKSTVSSDADVFFSLVTSSVEEDDDSTKGQVRVPKLHFQKVIMHFFLPKM